MDIVIQWTTKIILFLLLASVVDLLIPAGSMKKYIRLVVGLILILIFLKPLFLLFDINVQQSMKQSFSQMERQESNPNDLENLIKKQKKEIESSQRAYILEEMAVPLKELAEEPLKKQLQVQIASIDFRFSQNRALTYENLDKVIVYLEEADRKEGEENVVKEVVINTDESFESEQKIDKEKVKQILEDAWELDKDTIKLTIVWRGGTS